MATFPNWLPLDDEMFEALEPFKVAMDNEEQRNSRHPASYYGKDSYVN